MSRLDPDSFELERAIVEVRFEAAFSHWDRAGLLWTSARGKWPSLKMAAAQPNQTSFSVGHQFDLTVELEAARVLEHRPAKSLQTLAPFATQFVGLVCHVLEITTLNRIGFRQIFVARQKDAASAAEAVVKTGLLKIPTSKQFSIDDARVLYPEYVMKLEGDTHGVRLGLKAETHAIDFNPPAELEGARPIKEERHRVQLDVDYYTLGAVDLEQIDLSDWLLGAGRIVRRDSARLLEGWQA